MAEFGLETMLLENTFLPLLKVEGGQGHPVPTSHFQVAATIEKAPLQKSSFQDTFCNGLNYLRLCILRLAGEDTKDHDCIYVTYNSSHDLRLF